MINNSRHLVVRSPGTGCHVNQDHLSIKTLKNRISQVPFNMQQMSFPLHKPNLVIQKVLLHKPVINF